MAITAVEYGAPQASASYDRGISVTQRWQVESDDVSIGPLVAMSAVVDDQLGGWGATYQSGIGLGEFWSTIYLVNANPTPGDVDGYIWFVDVQYQTLQLGAINPLLEPVVVEKTFSFQEIPVDRDYANQPVRSSIGLPYPEPFILKKARQVWTFTKNVAQEPIELQGLFGAINNGGYRGAAQYCLKYDFYTVDYIRGHQLAGNYCRVKHQMTYDPDGHVIKKYNEGLYKLENGKLVPGIDEKSGQPITEPRMLNAAGTEFLPPGATPIINKYYDGPRISFGIFSSYIS